MRAEAYTLFDTAIGACGLAWNERAIAGAQLPEAGEAATRARLQRRYPGSAETPAARAPAAVQQAIADIQALLQGEARDLSHVQLDMEGVPEFHCRVFEVARRIPPGATCSYGDVAVRLGERGAARAVGQALGRNPFPIIVPCHRVLAAGGRVGGFSARGGTATKLRLLQIEGAQLFAV